MQRKKTKLMIKSDMAWMKAKRKKRLKTINNQPKKQHLAMEHHLEDQLLEEEKRLEVETSQVEISLQD